MKLSEMKQVLADKEVQLTKSLGQNFLHDGNQLRRIVQAAELHPSDKILEIGPGLGPLTELLLKEVGYVFAIEKDARLARILRERFETHAELAANGAGLCLIQADALEYLKYKVTDWNGWKLVANLPYAVASPILVELAQSLCGPKRLVATLQLEVARRLMAKSNEPDYGLLTLLVQVAYEPSGYFKIPASCFFPVPEVDSACVVLVRRQASLLNPDERSTFGAIVKRSFSQRRKMMAKLLKADWSVATIEGAFAEVALPAQTRAEAVSLEQFISLAKIFHERGNL
jgi:16S rRNA (adenine1518-N6/adenine1519-N6)-dimethyltransferase